MARTTRAAVADAATAAAPPTETPGPDDQLEPGDTPPDDTDAGDPEAEADTVTVIMRSRIGGTRNGEEWPPVGGTKTLPRAEADALCAAGWARPV